MDTTERWYCIMCGANREAEAAWNLKRQGYAVFWPRRWVTWSHNGKTTSELRSYLSRYLFAAVGEHQSVGAINDTDGVSRVITMCGDAYEVPHETMWALRRGFDPEGVEPPGSRTSRHIRKMLIGVKGDAAAELLAVLERIDDRGRMRVRKGRGRAPGPRASLPLLKRKAAENSHSDLARGAAA